MTPLILPIFNTDVRWGGLSQTLKSYLKKSFLSKRSPVTPTDLTDRPNFQYRSSLNWALQFREDPVEKFLPVQEILQKVTDDPGWPRWSSHSSIPIFPELRTTIQRRPGWKIPIRSRDIVKGHRWPRMTWPIVPIFNTDLPWAGHYSSVKTRLKNSYPFTRYCSHRRTDRRTDTWKT